MFSAARLDQVPMAAWIAAVVLAFILWWPAGVALLVFLGASGRLMALACGPRGRWHNADAHRGRGCGWGERRGGWRDGPASGPTGGPTGNRAFDDYREETLRRLEEEQREFAEYLDRLRRARDKEEFDQFMTERRRRPPEPPPVPQGE